MELATIGQRVEGVYEGTAPIAGNHAISIGAPIIRNQNNSELYIELPHQNIASLDTSNSQIKLKLQSANKAAAEKALQEKIKKNPAYGLGPGDCPPNQSCADKK